MLVEGEIHHGEAVEEKISLSGRFGIWVAFHPFSQDQYLEVVRQWIGKLAARLQAEVPWDDACREAAILWSQKKGDRSGRIANQFASDWVGQYLLKRREGGKGKGERERYLSNDDPLPVPSPPGRGCPKGG